MGDQRRQRHPFQHHNGRPSLATSTSFFCTVALCSPHQPMMGTSTDGTLFTGFGVSFRRRCLSWLVDTNFLGDEAVLRSVLPTSSHFPTVLLHSQRSHRLCRHTIFSLEVEPTDSRCTRRIGENSTWCRSRTEEFREGSPCRSPPVAPSIPSQEEKVATIHSE